MREMESISQANILYIKVREKDGQIFINFLKRQFRNTQIIDQRFQILHEHDNILYPIIEDGYHHLIN